MWFPETRFVGVCV